MKTNDKNFIELIAYTDNVQCVTQTHIGLKSTCVRCSCSIELIDCCSRVFCASLDQTAQFTFSETVNIGNNILSAISYTTTRKSFSRSIGFTSKFHHRLVPERRETVSSFTRTEHFYYSV